GRILGCISVLGLYGVGICRILDGFGRISFVGGFFLGPVFLLGPVFRLGPVSGFVFRCIGLFGFGRVSFGCVSGAGLILGCVIRCGLILCRVFGGLIRGCVRGFCRFVRVL